MTGSFRPANASLTREETKMCLLISVLRFYKLKQEKENQPGGDPLDPYSLDQGIVMVVSKKEEYRVGLGGHPPGRDT